MKKTLVSVLALVLVVSLSLVAFVACNDKDDNKNAKVSNTEVLGTTVAVLASNAAGSASAAAEDDADVNFNAGVNITVGDNNQLTLGSEVVAKGIATTLKPMIQTMVDRVDEVLGENGVKVEKVNSDDAEYTEKYSITITYVDEESGEESTRSLSLYVKLSEGAEIEGKTNYTFDAKVMWVGADGKEVEVAAFKGEANFDKAKDAMIFTLGAQAGDEENVGAFANIKAYATAQGTVKIEMGAGAGVSEVAGANAALSVEIGKLADGKYGAIVTAQGDASVNNVPVVGNVGVNFVATINVYANSQENAGEFALNGNVEATVTAMNVTYKGTADLTGKAVYDADKDEAVVGLNGVINFTKVQEENK
mgnify:CR=1 FL=1